MLREKLAAHYGSGTGLTGLRQLSMGASRETWSFEAVLSGGEEVPLILKRDPMTASAASPFSVSRITEGTLIRLANGAGVASPEVPFFLEAEERTSEGFIMQRLEGETLARRILRDEAFAEARTRLAYQCGRAAAQIHHLQQDRLPPLKSQTVLEMLADYRSVLDEFGHPHPGFQYGLRWLAERAELAGDGHGLIHGDFRNGNIMVGPEGLRGVLDWELAQLGNPVGDLGWICIPAWRYGEEKPVGGFGEVDDMLEGYAAGGGDPISPETLHYWLVFGCLKWGIICLQFAIGHLSGTDRSMEKAAIGRRAAETEYDLLQLVD